MELFFKKLYDKLSDKEIVDKIVKEPYDEEAATYLIYDRYEPLCISICKKAHDGVPQPDELQSELFMLLKGKNHDWNPLKSFGWRSSFGTWLSITAYNLFLDLRRNLIENNGENTSLDNGWDDENTEHLTIEIPVDEEKRQERRYNMILLNEIIHKLENPDQRFVVIHRLKGYSSREVSIMLQEYWDANGIVRYNNKKEVVLPDSGYIDNLFKRGYDKVSDIFKKLTERRI